MGYFVILINFVVNCFDNSYCICTNIKRKVDGIMNSLRALWSTRSLRSHTKLRDVCMFRILRMLFWAQHRKGHFLARLPESPLNSEFVNLLVKLSFEEVHMLGPSYTMCFKTCNSHEKVLRFLTAARCQVASSNLIGCKGTRQEMQSENLIIKFVQSLNSYSSPSLHE